MKVPGPISFNTVRYFSGQHFLPNDNEMDLQSIRDWAIKKGWIGHKHDFLENVWAEQGTSVYEFFSPDEIVLAIHIYKDNRGQLQYLERPYVPLKSLIQKGTEIEIVFLIVEVSRDYNGRISFYYNNLSLGFWYPGCTEELCTSTSAKLVGRKFISVFKQLFHQYDTQETIVPAYNQEEMQDKQWGYITMREINGDVKATFSKVGRSYDVELKVKTDD